MGILLDALGLSALSSTPPSEPTDGATVTPPSRADRAPVNLDAALTLPAVLRAIQLLAGMAAQLHIETRRGRDLITNRVVDQPDPWRDQSSWIERIVVNLATEGNAFLHKVPANDDPTTVAALIVLDPWRVHVWRDRHNRVWYDYTDLGGKRHRYARADIIHLWALEIPGHERALGPITRCRVNLGGALDARDYANGIFRRGGVTNGVLSSDQQLDPATSKAYKEEWRNGDHRPGDIRVLGRGLTYQGITISPKDAQWLETQAFNVIDIARMFGIPAPLLEAAIEGDSLTYQTLLDVVRKFLTTTLFPVYLRKIERALTQAIPRGQTAHFNTDALTRPDDKTRLENHGLAIDAGIYGPAYARELEGIPEHAAPRQETPA